MKKKIRPYTSKQRNSLSSQQYLTIERDFHDKYASVLNWDEEVLPSLSFDNDSGGYKREIDPFFRKLLGDVSGKKVLDIGSGHGNMALNLALQGAHVSSIDIAPKLIEGCKYRARKHELEIDFKVMDACDLEYPDGYFDIIVGFRVVHHLPDLEKFFKEAFRTLKKDGFLLITEPQKYNPFVQFGRYFIKNGEHSRTPTEHPIVPNDIKMIKNLFGNLQKKEFELLKPASLFFSMMKMKSAMRVSSLLLGTIDNFLWYIPFLRPLYWQVVIKAIKK